MSSERPAGPIRGTAGKKGLLTRLALGWLVLDCFQFCTLAWNVKEKVFGLLGETTECSPRPVC